MSTLPTHVIVTLLLFTTIMKVNGKRKKYSNDISPFLTENRQSRQRMFPSSDVSKVRFLLWTRRVPPRGDPQVLKFAGPEWVINNTDFDPERKTAILAHGYADTGETGWIRRATKELLKKDDLNVISVDWRDLCPSPWYPVGVRNTYRVGVHTAEFLLSTLMDGKIGVKYEDISTVVGFSLGAHVVGNLGNALDGKIGRITGLDPAGLLFHSKPKSRKLNRFSAKFVDVVHAAGRWIGTDETVGHVDFYPNSGKAPQPGCEHKDFVGLHCSHMRATDLYIESINSDVGFLSYKCPSWKSFKTGSCNLTLVDTNKMGFPASNSSLGVFFLRTRSSPPYAISPNIKYNSSHDDFPLIEIVN